MRSAHSSALKMPQKSKPQFFIVLKQYVRKLHLLLLR